MMELLLNEFEGKVGMELGLSIVVERPAEVDRQEARG